jgi:membrane-bound lytic murein transglycosylase B
VNPRVRRWPHCFALAAYQAAEAKLAVSWEYLAAIHLVETGLGRIRGTSSAGAQGPMQFLPSTWKR